MSAGCFNCDGSYWVIPPVREGHKCSQPAMRCACVGGPQKLAEIMETRERPDHDLAKRLKKCWADVSQEMYKAGLQCFPCDCLKQPLLNDDLPF